MDKFKQYLQEHRDDLGNDEPGDKVWQNIQNQLPSKNKTIPLFIRIAAACVILLCGWAAWYTLSTKKINNTPIVVSHPLPKVQPLTNGKKDNAPIASIQKKEITRPHHSIAKHPAANDPIRIVNELESSFTQVINLQRSRISSTPLYGDVASCFADCKAQLKKIDKDELDLKKEIAKHGLDDQLLGQLININQQKLNVLKQLQTEMNKSNNRFKQNHTPENSNKPYFLTI